MAKTCKEDNCNSPVFSNGHCVYHRRLDCLPQYQIKSKVSVRSKKKVAQVSAKQKIRLTEYKVVRDQFMLAHPVCQFKGCNLPATDLHHKKSRAYHLCDVEIFMSICREHHTWVHDNDKEARELGYLLSSI